MNDRSDREFEYDVVISFAGEDRSEAEQFARALEENGLKVFYGEWESDRNWEANLFERLQSIYRDGGRYCVILVSRHYVEKDWSIHEFRSTQERALRESREYILPIRLNDSELPGLHETIGYVDRRKVDTSEIAESNGHTSTL